MALPAFLPLGGILAQVPTGIWLTHLAMATVSFPPAIAAAAAAWPVLAVVARFGLLPAVLKPLVRPIGIALLALGIFGAGVRVERELSAVEVLRADNATLRGEKAVLEHRLANQKIVDDFAASERARLAADRDQAEQKVTDYEQLLKLAERAGDACRIGDNDLRFRRSLRRTHRAAGSP